VNNSGKQNALQDAQVGVPIATEVGVIPVSSGHVLVDDLAVTAEDHIIVGFQLRRPGLQDAILKSGEVAGVGTQSCVRIWLGRSAGGEEGGGVTLSWVRGCVGDMVSRLVGSG